MKKKGAFVSIEAEFGSLGIPETLKRHGHDARSLRDLWVQMQRYCRATGSDGFVPDHQLAQLVEPDPPRIALRDAQRLVAAGLIELGVGGYYVPAYLDANASQETRERRSAGKSAGAVLANHERWHAKRGEPEPGCVYCQSTNQSTDQFTDRSTDEFTDQYTDQTSDLFTDQSSDNGAEAVLFQGGTPPYSPPPRSTPNGEADPRFTDFWAVYPRKVGKPRSVKAWRAAMRRKHDPDLIIKAAQAYRDDPRRNPQYTAHPSTWLNDERYNDQPGEDDQQPSISNSPWEN